MELFKKWNFKSTDYFEKIKIYDIFRKLFQESIIDKIKCNHL